MRKLIVLLALSACGSGGLPFVPNSELANQLLALPDGGVDSRYVFITLAKLDQGPLDCADSLDAGITALSGPILGIVVARLDGMPWAIDAYPVVLDILALDAGIGASIAVGNFDGGFTAGGISGTVNLTAVGSTYVGNFNAQTIDINTLVRQNYSGSFSAPLCVP
jgi:hypothetical protein